MSTAKYQVAAWSAFAAIVFVTVSPIEMRPGDMFSVDVDRALAFGLLSSMFMVAYPRQSLLVGGFIVLSAGGSELLQALSPTRHARIDDAVVKTVGAVGGMAVALSYNALRVLRHARRDLKRASSGVAATPTAGQDADGMQLIAVTSDMIEMVYFSPRDGRLRIRMHNGEERLFAGVSESDVTALATAASPDRYYAENIRSKFPRKAA